MKLNTGELNALLHTDIDMVDELDELETYEPSNVNKHKMRDKDLLEINGKSKNRHYRESSKRNWSEE
jgi:hypothetical protein